MRQAINLSFVKIFLGWYWLKCNNLRQTLKMTLKFYTIVIKWLKLTVRKFWWSIPTFTEVAGEKLVQRPVRPTSPILNRTNE